MKNVADIEACAVLGACSRMLQQEVDSITENLAPTDFNTYSRGYVKQWICNMRSSLDELDEFFTVG